MANSFFLGVSYLLASLSFLKQNKLIKLAIIPVIINAFLTCFLISVSYHFGESYIDHLSQIIPVWLTLILNGLWIVVLMVGVLFSCYFSAFLTAIICAPFCNYISEIIEEKYLATQSIIKPQENKRTILTELLNTFKREIQKACYYFVRILILMLSFLIPIVNIATPLLLLGFGAWMMAIQMFDYPIDNHGKSFNELKEIISDKPLLFLGFGSGCLLFASIPIVNLIAVPVCVCAATLLFCENQHNNMQP